MQNCVQLCKNKSLMKKGHERSASNFTMLSLANGIMVDCYHNLYFSVFSRCSKMCIFKNQKQIVHAIIILNAGFCNPW